MGQEQSQPIDSQNSSRVQQNYQQQQYYSQNQHAQQTPSQVEEEQRKMQRPNAQIATAAAPVFQGSFSAVQAKSQQDERVDSNYNPLADSNGNNQSKEAANIVQYAQQQQQQQQQVLQNNTFGTNQQSQEAPLQKQLQQDQLLQQQLQQQQQYQQQLLLQQQQQLQYQQQQQQQQQATVTQQNPAIPPSSKYTASFGQLEQMMLNQANQQQQTLSANIPTSNEARAQQPNSARPPVAFGLPANNNDRYFNNHNQETSAANNPNESSQKYSTDPKKAEMIERLLSSRAISAYEQQSTQKCTPYQSEQFVSHLLQKGKQIDIRNRITSDYYSQRDVEECTFQPNVSAVSVAKSISPQRFQKTFLAEQEKFVAARDQNIRRIQTDMAAKDKEKFTHRPEILKNSQVVMISNASKYAAEPAFKRLYDLQQRKKETKTKHDKELKEKEEEQKNNQKKSNPQTIDRLYNLGKMKLTARREGKPDPTKKQKEDNEKQKEGSSKNDEIKEETGALSQKQSEYCLATKLIKEYEQVVVTVVQDAKQQNYLLDYIQVSEVLRQMGFISYTEKVESHNFVKERTLVNDVWIALQGSANQGVSYRNLLLLIFGIMGISIDLPRFKKGNDQVLRIEYSKDLAHTLLRDVAEANNQQEAIDKGQQIRNSQFSGNQNNNNSQLIQRSSQYNSQMSQQEFGQNISKSIVGSSIQQLPQQVKPNYNDMNEDLKAWMDNRAQLLHVGTFDQENNLILSTEQVKQIQIFFQLFYLNRLHTEKNKLSYNQSENYNSNSQSSQNGQISQSDMVSHEQTEELAQNYRSRIYEQTILGSEKLQQLGDKIQHADILMAQREEKKKYLEQIKQDKDESDLFDCTFHPKTNNYVQTSQNRTQFISNQSGQQQQQQQQQQELFGTSNASNQHERPNNNPMPPTSLGNNKRYLDLYNLSKPRSQLRDKKTFEIEYEKNCDECTFSPDLGATNNHIQQKLRMSKDVEVKNRDLTVERLRRAWDNSQKTHQKLERGYYEFKDISNTKNKQNMPNLERKRIYSQRQFDTNHARNNNIPFKRPFTGASKLDTGLAGFTFGGQPKQQQQQQQYINDMLKNQSYQTQSQGQLQRVGNNNNFNENNLYPYQENEQYIDGERRMQNNGQGMEYDWMGNAELEQQQLQQQQQQMQQRQQNPLLFVDINLSADKQERIIVYEGDRPEDLATEFIKQHGLDESLHEKLTQMLQAQIESSTFQQQSMQ